MFPGRVLSFCWLKKPHLVFTSPLIRWEVTANCCRRRKLQSLLTFQAFPAAHASTSAALLTISNLKPPGRATDLPFCVWKTKLEARSVFFGRRFTVGIRH